MLESLNLVRGAVSDGKILTVLSHFHISNGRVYGSDGNVTISAPFPEIHTDPITVPAVPFLRAVDYCGPGLNFTVDAEKQVLRISKGRFRSRIPLSDHAFGLPDVKGSVKVVQGEPTDLLAALRKLSPFISNDASRPWALSVMVRNGYLWSTNNVVIARVARAWSTEEFTIPDKAVKELLRIKQEPSKIYKTANGNILFELEDSVRVFARCVDAQWPDIESLYAKHTENRQGSWSAVDEPLRNEVRNIVPFCEDQKFPIVQFEGRTVKTKEGTLSAEIDIDQELPLAFFDSSVLIPVLQVSNEIHIQPPAHLFRGDDIEGIIAGVRVQ